MAKITEDLEIISFFHAFKHADSMLSFILHCCFSPIKGTVPRDFQPLFHTPKCLLAYNFDCVEIFKSKLTPCC